MRILGGDTGTNCRRNCSTSRLFSTSLTKDLNTILRIPKADVYRFGDGNKVSPVFKDLEWTINEGESWAIVGPAGNEKSLLLEVRFSYTISLNKDFG